QAEVDAINAMTLTTIERDATQPCDSAHGGPIPVTRAKSTDADGRVRKVVATTKDHGSLLVSSTAYFDGAGRVRYTLELRTFGRDGGPHRVQELRGYFDAEGTFDEDHSRIFDADREATAPAGQTPDLAHARFERTGILYTAGMGFEDGETVDGNE